MKCLFPLAELRATMTDKAVTVEVNEDEKPKCLSAAPESNDQTENAKPEKEILPKCTVPSDSSASSRKDGKDGKKEGKKSKKGLWNTIILYSVFI